MPPALRGTSRERAAPWRGVSFTWSMYINLKQLQYKLNLGSSLLRVTEWESISNRQLKSLIQRFATREAKLMSKGKPSFNVWRNRRLKAVEIFEQRFVKTPEIFKLWKMPTLKSYYINNGKYIWPSSML